MDSVIKVLYEDAVDTRYYRATKAEERMFRKADKWGRQDKRFQYDLLEVLRQYERQGFALGLRYGLGLAEELFTQQNLCNRRRFGIMDANER